MSKLDSLLGVRRHLTENALRSSGAACSKSEPPGVEDVDCDRKPFSDCPKNIVRGNLEILVQELRLRGSANPQFAHRSQNAKSGHVGSYDECGKARDYFAPSLHRSLRKSRDNAGAMRIPDP